MRLAKRFEYLLHEHEEGIIRDIKLAHEFLCRWSLRCVRGSGRRLGGVHCIELSTGQNSWQCILTFSTQRNVAGTTSVIDAFS